jgi:pimeloyl-ACP methyl ester carboxylesterase
MASLLSAETVLQRIDGDHEVLLRKEVLRFDAKPGLFVVRKHLPGGPTLPPVLLVHGFAQNRYTWHTSRRSMSAWLAAAGFDVWNLELRGHGRNREAGGDGAEAFADYVADVAALVDELPDRPFVIGHSLGGAVLYAAATALPPGALRGVVGIGAVYHFGQDNPALMALCRLTHSFRDAPWMSTVQVRTGLAGILLGKLYGLSDIAGYASPISGWWPGSVEPELLAERLERGFDWTSVRVWQEMSRWAATGTFDYDEAWRQTDVPVLVCLGDRDHLMPVRDGRVAYERSGSADRSLHVFDDYRHAVHWGHLDLVLGKAAPDHVWPRVADWMRERS